MIIDDDLDPTIIRVVESYLSARGEPLDDISCPDLAALWEAMKNDKTAKTWVAKNCKFASKS